MIFDPITGQEPISNLVAVVQTYEIKSNQLSNASRNTKNPVKIAASSLCKLHEAACSLACRLVDGYFKTDFSTSLK